MQDLSCWFRRREFGCGAGGELLLEVAQDLRVTEVLLSELDLFLFGRRDLKRGRKHRLKEQIILIAGD